MLRSDGRDFTGQLAARHALQRCGALLAYEYEAALGAKRAALMMSLRVRTRSALLVLRNAQSR